jgi:molecular chaperone IbpA
MRTYDISPLWRSTIGFDRFFRQVDAAQHAAGEDDYPPCNVERLSDDRWPASLLMISSIGHLIAALRASVLPGRSRPGGREHCSTMVCSRSRWFRAILEAAKSRRIPIDNLAASDVQQLEPRAA